MDAPSSDSPDDLATLKAALVGASAKAAEAEAALTMALGRLD